MDQPTQQKDLMEMSYEECRDELAGIVTKLEEGSSSLEQSLKLWERGEALARRCSEWLDSAQARLDAVERPEEQPVSPSQDE